MKVDCSPEVCHDLLAAAGHNACWNCGVSFRNSGPWSPKSFADICKNCHKRFGLHYGWAPHFPCTVEYAAEARNAPAGHYFVPSACHDSGVNHDNLKEAGHKFCWNCEVQL